MISDGKIPFSDLSSTILKSDIDIRSFKCADDRYTRFLKRDAIEGMQECTACTHLVFYKTETLVGYFTLINDIIQGDGVELKDEKPGFRYDTYPAMKIARLATHRDWEGRGIGRYMLMLSISYAIRLNNVSACRFITLDAVNEKVSYYQRHGFVSVEELADEKTTPMYLNHTSVINAQRKQSSQTKLGLD
nr:GNAT family N-acetyltransferase [uncultured Methanospirillum sp.]